MRRRSRSLCFGGRPTRALESTDRRVFTVLIVVETVDFGRVFDRAIAPIDSPAHARPWISCRVAFESSCPEGRLVDRSIKGARCGIAGELMKKGGGRVEVVNMWGGYGDL